MEVLIGIGIWVLVFVVWYVRNYPERVRTLFGTGKLKIRWPLRKKPAARSVRAAFSGTDFKSLVETVEVICAKDKYTASDAATMVAAVKKLLVIEPPSGQIWEAYALDSLETSEIVCDDCHVEVQKMVRKTGVKIRCPKCNKWLALKNSKVTVIDPNRSDLDDWEI
ncbi:MAG: hypothetical protein AB1646_02355 [Thermodesulfobacteriota bacterium]